MIEHTATTGMREWTNSGWTLASGYIQEALFAPPPRPMKVTDLVQDVSLGPQVEVPSGEFEVMRAEDYEDYIEDVFAAQQAMEEYERDGLKGTIAYREFRDRYTGSES